MSGNSRSSSGRRGVRLTNGSPPMINGLHSPSPPPTMMMQQRGYYSDIINNESDQTLSLLQVRNQSFNI